jgi:hypothetical protein
MATSYFLVRQIIYLYLYSGGREFESGHRRMFIV